MKRAFIILIFSFFLLVKSEAKPVRIGFFTTATALDKPSNVLVRQHEHNGKLYDIKLVPYKNFIVEDLEFFENEEEGGWLLQVYGAGKKNDWHNDVIIFMIDREIIIGVRKSSGIILNSKIKMRPHLSINLTKKQFLKIVNLSLLKELVK